MVTKKTGPNFVPSVAFCENGSVNQGSKLCGLL